MKYSEFLEKEYNKEFASTIQKEREKKIGVVRQYKKKYSDEVGDKTAKFYYKISEAGQPYFNAIKTNAVINYSQPLDYNYIHRIVMPGEIVATSLGYNSYNDFCDRQSELSNAQLLIVKTMIDSLIPITEEEYNKIQ